MGKSKGQKKVSDVIHGGCSEVRFVKEMFECAQPYQPIVVYVFAKNIEDFKEAVNRRFSHWKVENGYPNYIVKYKREKSSEEKNVREKLQDYYREQKAKGKKDDEKLPLEMAELFNKLKNLKIKTPITLWLEPKLLNCY